MQKRIIFFTTTAAISWCAHTLTEQQQRENPQELFFDAAKYANVNEVKRLLSENKINLAAKNSANLTALQLVAQQALPVEDKWLQFKYDRMQAPPTAQPSKPSVSEREVEKKLLDYLNIAQILLKAGGDKKDLITWDRQWFTGQDSMRQQYNDYPLNFAKSNVNQEETAARKRFVEEQNKLAYFFKNDVIR